MPIAVADRPIPRSRSCERHQLVRIVSGMPLCLCRPQSTIPPAFRRERARESCKFTLKGNRAERVQIVNAAFECRGIISTPRLRGARLGLLLAERLGVAGEVFDTDARQRHAEFTFGSGHCRQHDFLYKLRT